VHETESRTDGEGGDAMWFMGRETFTEPADYGHGAFRRR